MRILTHNFLSRRGLEKLHTKIPTALTQWLEKIKTYGEHNIETESVFVEGCRYAMWIGTKWSVAPHTDDGFPEWSYILIVHNEGMVVHSIEDTSGNHQKQPPNTIVELNIHALHWLVPGREVDDPTWVALVIDSDKQLKKKDVLARFRKLTRHII